MSGDTRIAVAAVGIDLGGTLYHYRDAPMRWLEQGLTAIERVFDACGIDRSKARVTADHKRPAGYRARLRKWIWRVAASEDGPGVFGAFFEIFRRGLEAYPDAIETLAALKQSGFAVGALTNVPLGMPLLTHISGR
jgi:FMN phosphatase YigB (HAD superfamily)